MSKPFSFTDLAEYLRERHGLDATVEAISSIQSSVLVFRYPRDKPETKPSIESAAADICDFLSVMSGNRFRWLAMPDAIAVERVPLPDPPV